MSSTTAGAARYGIALDVAIFHDDVPQMMAIVAHEAVAPFVEGVAELPEAGDRFVVVRMTGSKRKSMPDRSTTAAPSGRRGRTW